MEQYKSQNKEFIDYYKSKLLENEKCIIEAKEVLDNAISEKQLSEKIIRHFEQKEIEDIDKFQKETNTCVHDYQYILQSAQYEFYKCTKCDHQIKY